MTLASTACLMAAFAVLIHPALATGIPTENSDETLGKKTETVRSNFPKLVRNPTPLTVDKVIDGLHFLASDKTIYVLPNLRTPENIPDLDKKTKERLETLLKGQRCTLYQTKVPDLGRTDRMDNKISQLECGTDRTWIEGQLVREGLAMVWPNPSNPELLADLYTEEQKARQEKLGIWAENGIEIQTPETVKTHLNSVQIIEGRVENASLTKNNLYLNFEQNWKEDFTVGISKALQKEFSKQNISLQSLKGKYIRIRGWVRNYNGPYIELEQIGQLELLDKSSSSPILQPSTSGMKTISNNTAINEPEKPSIAKPSTPTLETSTPEKTDIEGIRKILGGNP